QLGESVVEGTVSRWLKQVGDPVTAFEPLLEVATDKVETEIPSPASGVLTAILIQAGQTVSKGTTLAIITGADERPVASSDVSALAAPAAGPRPHVTPVVARMAAEHGLDLAQIAGTGQGGRVTKKDVEAYLARRAQAVPASGDDVPPWERPGSGDLFKPSEEYTPTSGPAPAPTTLAEPLPGGVEPLTAMRRAIAEHMVQSKRTSPHVTTVFEIDMGAVLAHQRAHEAALASEGVRLTLTAYFAAAAVEALRAEPIFNATWTDAGIRRNRAIHLGVAVAVPDGLIVPVIRNAGDLSLIGLARALSDITMRARGKALQPGETSGGTFTITNHGVSGSLLATPIIHQPQAAILGVGALEKRVRVITDAAGSDAIAIRPCLYVTLTFDHRLADGAAADRFLSIFKARLEAWR
ncbi:MAG: 2-oxo acid dehydrogenase subunit E2, partial [Anaerolinea sp.]|nr:2-oxo acid dehydrogenase subunit E2 [Anaerolinea sp.]